MWLRQLQAGEESDDEGEDYDEDVAPEDQREQSMQKKKPPRPGMNSLFFVCCLSRQLHSDTLLS
jgi:hypothetical protein